MEKGKNCGTFSKALSRKVKRLEISWRVIAVSAAVMGVLSAVMALICPARISFHNISSDLELWLIAGVFILQKTNDRTLLVKRVAAFFAGAHLLSAVIQSVFGGSGAMYFFDWLPVIILSVPAAYLAFLSKYGGAEYALTYSSCTVILLIKGLYHTNILARHFPMQALAVVFCFGMAGVMIFKLMKQKSYRYYSLAAFALTVLIFTNFAFAHSFEYECTVLLSSKYKLDKSWSAKTENTDISKAEIKTGASGSASLLMDFYEDDPNIVTLTDGEGNEYKISVSCDDEGNVSVKE